MRSRRVDKINNLNQEAPSLCRKPNHEKPHVISRQKWANNLLYMLVRDVKNNLRGWCEKYNEISEGENILMAWKKTTRWMLGEEDLKRAEA